MVRLLRIVMPGVLAACGLLLLRPSAVAGGCAGWASPADVAGAETLFVGRVERLTPDRRGATVTVTEIWRGPALPMTVQVGADAAWSAGMARRGWSGVDRGFGEGRTYLFALRPAAGGDWSCIATSRFGGHAATLRPATPVAPVLTPAPAARTSTEALVAALGLTAAVGSIVFSVVALARRRAQ